MSSHLEDFLHQQLITVQIPHFITEYRFAAMHVGTGKGLRARLAEAGLKDWRFDFAWPAQRLAVEVEGGIYIGGRHNRGKGFENDLDKYHHAMRLGWTVYRVGARLIASGHAVNLIEAMLESQ